MQTKAFEIRDKGTFIPVLATLMLPGPAATLRQQSFNEYFNEYIAEKFLLRRAGYNITDPPLSVLLCRMDADGNARQASGDPYGWGINRTFTPAHLYIVEHWEELKSGAVIDVEFILNETPQPKVSERHSEPNH